MAQIPTPEESAKQILNIFVSDFNLRAGEFLMDKNLWHASGKRGLRTEDLNAGLDYAVQKGWIEASDTSFGQHFKLTDAGFAAA